MSAAARISDLLRTCPRLTILVTSRAPLHLSGEHDFAVPPLPVPDAHEPLDVPGLMTCPSVALFVMRARTVRTDFTLTAQNAAAVREICRRLDGLPLAIELAAARTRLLPPEALLARLSDRLALLVGGARDLPARHQTLRATIEWSHGLLAEAEQILFRRLSVFAGGCTLEAAEKVCTPAGDLSLDVLDTLQLLVDSSLVRPEAQPDGHPRVGMLDTVRAYARERLEASGEAAAVRRQHVAYFLGLAEAAERLLRGPDQAASLDLLEWEHDNLRAALRWAIDSADHEMELRLAGALGRFWLVRGYLTEGDRWLADALVRGSGESPEVQAKALNGAGNLAGNRGDVERATALHERALSLRRTTADQASIGQSLHNLGGVAVLQGNYPLAGNGMKKAWLCAADLGTSVVSRLAC